jgi:hypothetical protein
MAMSVMVWRAVISELRLKTMAILAAESKSENYLSNIRLFGYSYVFGKPRIR